MWQRWMPSAAAVLVSLAVAGCASTGAVTTPARASTAPEAVGTVPAPGGCVSQSHPANYANGAGVASSITVCPGRAPVGAVVHITLQGCDVPPRVAASLEFLGPSSFIGSSGGGDGVPFTPVFGDRATATFRIPRTYTGGEPGTPLNPTLPVKPGDHYSFATYPAAICDVGFTVTPG